MDVSDRPGAGPWRLLAVVPVVLALVLVVAAELGARQPGNFVVLRWFDRPYMFGALAMLLVGLAFGIVLRDPVSRAVAAGTLAFCALICSGAGLVAVSLRDDPDELSRYRSPDGAREIVTYLDFSHDYVDPSVSFRLRSGRGLFTREWDLACVHSDTDHLTSVEWPRPHTLRVNLAYGGPVDIVLDPLTGRPDTRLTLGCLP